MCLVLDSLHKHSVGVQLNYSMHVGLAVAKHDIVVACDGICMGVQNTSMRIKAVQCKDKTVANVDNNKKYSDGIPELESISKDSYIADRINSIDISAKITKTVIDQNLKVDEKSEIIGCIIGLDSEIGKNCKLENCIIGDNVIIADDSKITESVLGDNYNFKNEQKNEISEKILF